MSTAPVIQTNSREERHRHLQAAALFQNGGSRMWKNWKAAALEDLIQMAQQAHRLEFLRIDLSGDMDLVYRVQQPVPRRPRDGKLQIGNQAVYHMNYQEEFLQTPPPGWVPCGLLDPFDVFHPNAREALRGALCLGNLPPAVPPKELLFMAYYMLCLQDLSLSEVDPHGVLDSRACDYFRAHPEYLPLTTAGLFEPWTPEGGK